MNLISNAIKFTERGGRVTVKSAFYFNCQKTNGDCFNCREYKVTQKMHEIRKLQSFRRKSMFQRQLLRRSDSDIYEERSRLKRRSFFYLQVQNI